MAPRRRAGDTSGWLAGAAKATGGFLFFGILSFIGSWGIGLSNTVAGLKQDMAVMHEKQEFLAPWMVDEVKRMHEEIKEMRKDVQQLRRP